MLEEALQDNALHLLSGKWVATEEFHEVILRCKYV
jgi:hypothetical protein